ncbi:MAG: methylated-DNA--[protein]-cysteine S-methyltransferase [Candidatus Latescibacterota bacterium]|nr:MAG: methylated-DNA--[protein]-cysteine S-methyltransferase [Candidatus Latescibacterota bacterium]
MDTDFERIDAALDYIETHAINQPRLEDVARHVHLSPYHFQRLFKRWVGISPKRFLQYLTVNHAKQILAESRTVLDATYDSGLSSPGRLHDLFVNMDAVTPGEYSARGKDVTIRYGRHKSPFGTCLLAVTRRGICGLSFHDDASCADGLEYLQHHWPKSKILRDQATTKSVFEQVFKDPGDPKRHRLTLHVKGTNFQIKVWEALLRVAPGQLCAYGDIARYIGRPNAVRAVGSAVGSNPVAWLIPCHRVITSMGTFGNYRWGPARKKAIIGWEMARAG